MGSETHTLQPSLWLMHVLATRFTESQALPPCRVPFQREYFPQPRPDPFGRSSRQKKTNTDQRRKALIDILNMNFFTIKIMSCNFINPGLKRQTIRQEGSSLDLDV
jgi:hypothetical protein